MGIYSTHLLHSAKHDCSLLSRQLSSVRPHWPRAAERSNRCAGERDATRGNIIVSAPDVGGGGGGGGVGGGGGGGGGTASWHDPRDLGLSFFNRVRNHLVSMPISRLSEGHNNNFHFFHESLIYWEMLLAYVADNKQLDPSGGPVTSVSTFLCVRSLTLRPASQETHSTQSRDRSSNPSPTKGFPFAPFHLRRAHQRAAGCDRHRS